MEKNNNRYAYIDENGAHLHCLDGIPLHGTSTVVQILGKDGLVWWASGLAVAKFGVSDGKLLTAIKNKKIDDLDKEAFLNALSTRHDEIKMMNDEEYFLLVDSAYRAHSVKLSDSAGKGVALHYELEHFVNFCMGTGIPVPGGEDAYMFDNTIIPFMDWAYEKVDRFLASEVNCYSETLWTGGIVDCVALLKTGEIIIIDFKSSREAYLSQFFQIAGYDIALTENGGLDRNGNLTFVLPGKIAKYAVVPFGAKVVAPVIRDATDVLRQGFAACVTLTRIKNAEDNAN